MHFSLPFSIFLMTISYFVACGEQSKDAQSPRIGVPLQQAYSAYTGSVGTAFQQSEAVYLDSINRKIIFFSVDPFDVVDILQLPEGADASVFFAGKNNEFFLLKEKRGFGILKRSGDYLKYPIPMFGEVTSVSYDATNQRMVIQDNLDSVGLARLDDQGNVVTSWIGGPVIDGENSIVAGTILRNGIIAVSLSNGAMARIKFDESMAAGSWQFETFSLPEIVNSLVIQSDLTGLYWLSPVDEGENAVIARTATSIYMIDFDQMKITDTVTLDAQETGLHFNRNAGHVIVSNHANTEHYVVHAGTSEKLLKKKIHNVPVNGIAVDRRVEFSIMDAPSGSLTVMANLNNQLSILRNRLTDGLFVGAVDVANFEQTLVTDRHVIEVLDYKLGKAVRTEMQNPDNKTEIKAYNVRYSR